MNIKQLVLLLAAASLSAAAGCPFAKFAKPWVDGVPELDHNKVNAFVEKMHRCWRRNFTQCKIMARDSMQSLDIPMSALSFESSFPSVFGMSGLSMTTCLP